MKSEIVGKVIEVWRYPVKSMRGELLQSVSIESLGMRGDRGWALRDDESGEIRGAKKFPALMKCSSKYPLEPNDSTIPPAEIIFPDGRTINTDSDEVSGKISQFLEARVTLFPRLPATEEEHYRRKEQLSEPVIRQMLGLGKAEPLPDLNIFPSKVLEEITKFTSPRGTYVDAYPIHLLTTSWLEELQNHSSRSSFKRERFRPNLLIETETSGLAELDWCGKTLRIGTTELNCEIPTIRCSMTAHETGSLPKDPNVLRTIVQRTDRNVGVYASVLLEGQVNVGDEVQILEE